MAAGVPKDLDAVDVAWVESALRSAGHDVAVVGLGVEQIAVGAGYIGLLARLTPRYRDDAAGALAPRSLVVKIPSPEPGAQMLGTMLRLWEREGKFYRDVAPGLDVRTPRCYLSEQDPADGRVVLLLEDLADLDQPDQLVGTTRARAEHAIDFLAQLHGRTWGVGDDAEYRPWIPRPDDPMNTAVEPLLAASLPGFCASFPDVVTPQRVAIIERAIADFPSRLAERGAPFALGHGDFRLDNMLFDTADQPVVLDWQLLLVGAGTYDVAYFLAESLTTEQRQAWERPLLERYLSGVSEIVEPQLTGAELFDAYGSAIHFLCSLMPVTQVLNFEVNDRSRALARTIVERVLIAAEDHPIPEV